MTKIKPLTLEIEEKIWTQYKLTVPRDITLNDSVVQLIEKKVRK